MPITNPAGAGKLIKIGQYTSDDAVDRQITTGFKCSCVLLIGFDAVATPTFAVIMPNQAVRDTGGDITTGVILHATDGFRVGVTDHNYFNRGSTNVQHYWAISE